MTNLFERLERATTMQTIKGTLYLVMLFILLEFLFSALGDLIIGIATERLLRELRDRLYHDIIHRRYSELEGVDKGELRSRVMLDPQLVISFPCSALVTICSGLVKLTVGVILIFLISWSLSLLFLTSLPVLGAVAIINANIIQPRIRKQLDMLNATSATANDGFTNLRVIMMNHRADDEAWRFMRANKRFFRCAVRNVVINNGAETIKSFVLQALAVGLLWYGAVLVSQPSITSGLLLAFFLYIGLAAAGALSLSNVWSSYKSTLGALDRLSELSRTRTTPMVEFVEEIQMRVLSPASTKSPERFTLAMNNVTFKYGGFSEGRWALKDVSFSFKPSKSYAIVGPSCDVTTANSRDHLLSITGIVEQSPRVFHRSIWDNVTYGRKDPTVEAVDDVCRLTNCIEFIRHLPNGYDTIVGEDSGEVLSGGQKQRLAIARALLRDPQFLLLDEPTSELDVENARLIGDLIVSYTKMHKKTVIFITHSLVTCLKADVILFLSEGRITETGTHDELMRVRGSYYRYYKTSSRK